jgi:hypothetical protein
MLMPHEVTPEEKAAVLRQYAFTAAVAQAAKGKPKALVALLLGGLGRPLTDAEINDLQWLAMGEWKRKPGRPADQSRAAAEFMDAVALAKRLRASRKMSAKEATRNAVIFMAFGGKDLHAREAQILHALQRGAKPSRK